MTPGDTPIVTEETNLAFAGHGRDLVVRVASDIDAVEIQEALLIFLPRWRFGPIPASNPADVDVTFEKQQFRIEAVSWNGGYSIAADINNAANALAGLLIDGILAHGMAFCSLHAAAVEIDGSAVLFAGPSEAGKSTLALRLAARGCRHLADDRILRGRSSQCQLRAGRHAHSGGLPVSQKCKTEYTTQPFIERLTTAG